MGRIRKRCRQFTRALFSGMETEDHSFVDEFLDDNEKRLFYQTDPAIQKHCINVARTALIGYQGSEYGIRPKTQCGLTSDIKLLVKTSLLHDVGKTRGSFRLLDRVFYVIFSKLSPRLTKLLAVKTDRGMFRGLKNAFYVHLNHEKIGAELLENNGISQDIVFLVANHHNRSIAGQSAILSLLIEADEIN